MEENTKPQMQISVNQSPGAMVAFIVMIIAGIAMVIFGIKGSVEFNHFKKTCKETTGTVVDFRYYDSNNDDDDGYYHAILEYSVDCKTYEVESDQKSGFAPDLGEEAPVYYDPDDPENARTSLKERTGAILIVCGPLVGLFGAAFLLARFKANEEIIKILLGLALVILGFPLPIVAGAWVFLIISAIFGVCGIIIIVKAITKLTGNEGGAIDQAIDSKLETAGDMLIDTVAAVHESKETGMLSNIDVSPIRYIPKIIGGVGRCLFSLIFIAVGGFCVYMGEMIGSIFLLVGLGIFISGIVTIKHAFDLRKEYKETKMY